MKKFKKIGFMKLPCLLATNKVTNFRLFLYKFPPGKDYYVIEKGNVRESDNPLVRMQSACSFAVVFNSQRCDCKAQLEQALTKIAKSKAGLLIYVWPHEGRGIGMWDHVRVYMEQDKLKDTVSSYEILGLPVDSRDYSDIVEIIRDYGLKNVRLLTNNPRKVEVLREAGIEVIRISLIANGNKYNESQTRIKVEKLGHFFDFKERK